uniref:SEFIR domain-containing protein n=1 Tax=Panagrolaimus sp. ES5 TaxID=591445 RepID=A0AC34F6W3_9BILA
MLSPRFHFSTDSVFKFDQKYDVTLTSLPEMTGVSRSVRKTVDMPHNPGQNHLVEHVAENCTMYSHPFASKWTAGFRQIVLHNLARTIQVEFVGAPRQYCFEQYEVRLVDESGLELLHTDTISVDQMKTEVIDNVTMFFGEYNFTNLELDRIYVPSVIPVERAEDGRCLCPVDGTDPYDTKVICSCVAAEGKPVRLEKLIMEEPSTNNERNVTIPPAQEKEGEESSIYYFLIPIFSIILLVVLVHLIRFLYRRYSASGKMVRIRFVQDRQHDNSSGGRGLLNGNGIVQTPLILNPNLNILIIYAHDGKLHEAAVIAFAEYLRDVFNFEVHLDQWDRKNIEINMMDYISASVINADKVIIINSIGSNHRYHSKIMNNGYFVQRGEPDPLDSLFLSQIDQCLQHPFVISTRFSYSSFNDVMPTLNGCLQYVIPENLTPLLSALVGRSLKHDARVAGYNSNLAKLQTAISQFDQMRRNDPSWFDSSHVRVPITISPRKVPTPLLIVDDLPVVVAIPETKEVLSQPLLSGEGEEEESSTQMNTDSGVFDETGVHPSTSNTVEIPEDIENGENFKELPTISEPKIIIEEVNEEESSKHLSNPLSRLIHHHQDPPYNKLKEFELDSSADSGLVSDADLRMISAS